MKSRTRLRLAATPLAIALSLPSQPASAQQESAAPGEDEAILVTGSRIARPELDSPVPITSISGETFLEQGHSNVGDALNELPQLRSTRQQQNPGNGIGISGVNTLDLRGLGANRTLVLVNGRRHVAGDLLGTSQSPDINTIPNDLIERVDIITGGNSAIYGSDAIAGVVNFVLRRDFEGVQLRGNLGLSTPGGYGANQYLSAMAGRNFAGGRGNVIVHGEFAHQDRVFASDIPWLRTVEGLGIVDADLAGAPSDDSPDSIYLRNITNRNGSRYGTVFINQPDAAPGCGLGVGARPQDQVPYNCLLVFDAAGDLSPSSETARFGPGPIGSAIGGNLDNGREERFYSILPLQDRYNLNLLARYELSAAAEVFLEAKYARVETQGSNAGAAGILGNLNQFDTRERLRLDNPFLTPAQRSAIAEAILASGCNTSGTGTACRTETAFSGPLTPEQRAAVAAGTYRFALGRTEVAGGIRDERFRRETYRIVAGLRGELGSGWNYEASLNYGRLNERMLSSGFIDQQRLMLSLDAGLNPATGQIQCRAQFDPAAAVPFDTGAYRVGAQSRGNPDQAGRLAADIAACVPFNPFGGQYDNTAARRYFNVTTRNDSWGEQFVASAFVAGDSGQWFELPGGPVRFAVGGEYRQEDLYVKQDDFAGTPGNTNNVVLGPSGLAIDADPFKVTEGFAEVQLPVIRDMPFVGDLTLSGAVRVASYSALDDLVWAYNAGLEWTPVRDVRLRANYSRAVRAPYLSETAGAPSENFAPSFQDPCRPTGLAAGTSYRAANCAADLAGLPVQDRSYSLPIVSGPNPDLQPETSNAWTFGAVIQPRQVPGLSVTADYFDIAVNDIISGPTPQAIVNSCYDQPSRDNIFCRSFTRWRGPGNGPRNEAPGEILGNSLRSSPFNFARRVRRGIDAQLAYRTNVGGAVRLSTSAIYTHNFTNSNFEDPGRPAFENRLLGELGDPEDEFQVDTSLELGAVTLGHRLRYIGPMVVGPWENFNALNGLPPQNPDASEIVEYPEVFYNDIRLEWDLSEVQGRRGYLARELSLYAGVDNVFNTVPPLGATGAGQGGGGGASDRPGAGNTTGAIYDVRGRQVYVGFRSAF